jgi:hypothetical protein
LRALSRAGRRPDHLDQPFPAGGGTDVFARPLAAQVGDQLGVQILIDNKGGAGGTVGASQAAKMKPDGSAFLVGAVHHTIAPSIYKNLDYDLEKNFEPITMIALVPQVISINPTASGEDRGRADRVREEESRQGELRLGRRRHRASSGGRAVQARDQDRHRRTCPIAARVRDAGPAARATST